MINQISAQKIKRIVLLSSVLLSAKLFAPPITCNVTTTADNGNNMAPTPGSLRECIITTNANVGFTNTITFTGTLGVITPPTNLPTITNPVIIDGYTAAGASENTNPITAGNNAVITIEIRGPGTGNTTAPIIGLRLGAGSDGSTIRGLAISNFANVTLALASGVGIRIDSTNNTIEGNFVGTDVTGTISRPNFTNILVMGNSNLIGGTDPEDRNLLGGAYSFGNGSLRLNSNNNTVLQNTIGINAPGTAALMSDAHYGIVVSATSGTTTIGGDTHDTGNVISGNNVAGIRVNINTADTIIQNNYIGTDVTGTAAIEGNGRGIIVSTKNDDFPHVLRIQGNLISGNTYGINLGQNFLYPIRCAEINNNLIGTNATGDAAIPNSLDGIWVSYAVGTYISLNTISGNGGNGILVGKSKCTTIKSNFIGTDSQGTSPIPNTRNGIKLGNQVAAGVPTFGDVVGGAMEGEGNVISFNGENGISLVSYTQEEIIIGNTITNNGEFGIFVGPYTKNNYIGIYRQAGDHRLIGDIATQGGYNLGPLGTSNIITSNTLGGIAVQNSNNNTLQTNIIQSNGGDGISITDGSFNLVGGKVGGSTVATSIPPVRGNVITDNSGFGVSVNQLDGPATDNTIISNQIVDNTARGIALVDL